MRCEDDVNWNMVREHKQIAAFCDYFINHRANFLRFICFFGRATKEINPLANANSIEIWRYSIEMVAVSCCNEMGNCAFRHRNATDDERVGESMRVPGTQCG